MPICFGGWEWLGLVGRLKLKSVCSARDDPRLNLIAILDWHRMTMCTRVHSCSCQLDTWRRDYCPSYLRAALVAGQARALWYCWGLLLMWMCENYPVRWKDKKTKADSGSRAFDTCMFFFTSQTLLHVTESGAS